MHGIENHSAIKHYFQTKLAVIEVRLGECQEDAWRRYLAENPGNAGAQVKIFHFPESGVLPKHPEIRRGLPPDPKIEKMT